MSSQKEYRISFEEVRGVLTDKLTERHFSYEDASLSARLFTESSCDGVYSHGINRFLWYIDDIEKKYIKIGTSPRLIKRNGVLEQWDGQLGPGNLNAFRCTEHAVKMAREHGVSCVALAHTNHWMRGGTYGWQAADKGCLAIMWSNTTGNMPPWGGVVPTIGNNPFVMAVPRSKGHVVLDFSQSMFSFGKLSTYKNMREQLPFDGGYDLDGNLTRDPDAIEASMRPLPIGMWKGSGLAIMLDLFAMILSGGKSTMELRRRDHEFGVSQIFIVIAPGSDIYDSSRELLLDQIIDDIKETPVIDEHHPVRYPGEKTIEIRKENLRKGIPVQKEIWDRICSL
jgi:3-dehydro-L-gulonate 2-dehydrogenase